MTNMLKINHIIHLPLDSSCAKVVVVVVAPGSRYVNQVDRRFFAIATAHHPFFSEDREGIKDRLAPREGDPLQQHMRR